MKIRIFEKSCSVVSEKKTKIQDTNSWNTRVRYHNKNTIKLFILCICTICNSLDRYNACIVHSLSNQFYQTGEEAAQLRFFSFYFLLSLFSLFSSLSLLAVNFSDVGLGVFVPMARGVLGVNPPE